MNVWASLYILYLGIAGIVFVSCYPWNTAFSTPKDRFVQSFSALGAAILWPLPVLLSLAILTFVLGIMVVSLVVDRR